MKDLQYLLKRMSQSELARKIGMARSNICIWKKNKRVPELKAIKLKQMVVKLRGKK